MEVEDSEVPICSSCGHRHVQGVRCTICGHVGKSQIFSKMRQKAADGRAVSVECLSGGSCEDIHSKFNIVLELASQFVQEYECSYLDATSNHILCSVGDLPIATARWRLYQDDPASWILQIDRLVCNERYRRSGLAYRCLLKILTTLGTTAAGISRMEVIIPQHSDMQWLTRKLQAMGFTISDKLVESWYRGPGHVAVLDLGASARQRSEFDRILSYLLQKTATVA